MLKFSKANAKIEQLEQVPELEKFLQGGRKVYSLDLLSGHSCPFAEECLSKAVVQLDGKRKIQDGEKTKFRCFSASQEVQYTGVFNLRLHNFSQLQNAYHSGDMFQLLNQSMPDNLGICRIHVAGDFFNRAYFEAWMAMAIRHPDRLFYAYTKSLKYWVDNLDAIPDNLVLTASRGGRLDQLIRQHNLREARVVFSEFEAEALGLEVDHTDEHAAIPDIRDESFALLVHGTQPKGSKAADALKLLKRNQVKHSYSRKAGV